MLYHYLKIAFRNWRKNKTQSLIGILGLAFGMACFVPSVYWLRYETSYDAFYPDAKHIYRIYTVEKQSGKVNEQVPGILETKLHDQFPATENSTVFAAPYENFRVENTPHVRLRTLCTDSTFFRVFPQIVISGNARQPLQTTRDIILTEMVAVRLFGDVENAIGQQVESTLYSFPPYTVTAVVKNPPSDTNLPFDVIHFPEIQNQMTEHMPEQAQWRFFNKQMYVKFHPRTDVKNIAAQLRDITSQLGVNTNIELRALPISDVRHRLNVNLPFTLDFIRLFVAVGLLLLFSAFFNFLNLYLGLFRQRIRELRLRIVSGATGRQLIMQMIFELVCVIFLALLFAGCFVVLVQPLFSGLLNITMELKRLMLQFVVCGTGVMILILLVGTVPLWRLSRSAMRDLSKGKSTGQPVFRRAAVALQLAVSVVFIVVAGVVMMQLHFISRKDLGFDRHGIIQLTGMSYFGNKLQTALMHELTANPQIENITFTDFNPQHDTRGVTEIEWHGKQPHDKPVFEFITADSHFAETFRLKMIQGAWWNEGEQRKVVINEEAVRVMGLHDPTGTVIRMYPDYVSADGNNPMLEYEIVGVVNDFHTLSLRSRIHPTIIMKSSLGFGYYPYLRVMPGQEKEVMKRLTTLLPDIDASLVDARLTLLDEVYDRLNQSEQAGLKIFSVLAVVCLLISLFGIYAVATASTLRRRKEIAIRKVFGAHSADIVRMFLREYLWIVLIADAFALPVAYLIMSQWLQGYAYRTNIPWWLPTGVITAMVIVVLFTVLGQTLKAANGNPAEVVKAE